MADELSHRGGHILGPDALLDCLGMFQPRDIDIEVIAQYCGATVTYEPLSGCAARVLGYDNRAIIAVDQNAGEPRRRFSAAHELAHWLHDRGKVAAACTEATIRNSWGMDRESRANHFASDMLLPMSMFGPRIKGRDVTFATVDDLRKEFRTSMTATAIRLVKCGRLPSMIVCSSREGRKWFIASSDVSLWPTKVTGKGTAAYDLLHDVAAPDRPMDVDADEWIEADNADEYVIREHSRTIGDGLVLSLLWWKDQRQILDRG